MLFIFNLKLFIFYLAVRYVKPNPGTGLFQYFIKVVPTQYSRRDNVISITNQYTVTEKFRPVVLGDFIQNGVPQAGIIPGIFFVYELAPFMVNVTEGHIPLSHLITRLLAIVGGVFSVLAIVDSLIFKVHKLASKNV